MTSPQLQPPSADAHAGGLPASTSPSPTLSSQKPAPLQVQFDGGLSGVQVRRQAVLSPFGSGLPYPTQMRPPAQSSPLGQGSPSPTRGALASGPDEVEASPPSRLPAS